VVLINNKYQLQLRACDSALYKFQDFDHLFKTNAYYALNGNNFLDADEKGNVLLSTKEGEYTKWAFIGK
jgi:hypothetical protein